MPIYAYRCAACGHAKDVLRKISDPVLVTCPACGADRFEKQLTAAGFQLKGSGWYATDFRNNGSVAPATPADAEAKPSDGPAKPSDGAAKTEGGAAKSEGAASKTEGSSGKAEAARPAGGEGSAGPAKKSAGAPTTTSGGNPAGGSSARD